MIIPSKFNGFHNGVRRCFGGGGGGGGGGGDGDGGGGPSDVYTPTYTNTGNTNVNTNRGSVTGMNFNSTGNTAGTSNIRDNSSFKSMGGVPYNQAGGLYNSLLQQGFTGNDIRGALTTQGRPVSDSDYGFLVQNAAMTSPTGRPMAGSDQFFQPVYNTSYQNYARPATQFDVSTYGTQPVNSPLLNQTSRGNVNNALNTFYNTNYRDNPMGVSMSDTLNFMRGQGINRNDFQAFGGVNNYGPQMSMPQMQNPFNPYTNSSGSGGFGGYNGGYGGGYGGYMPQMQTPFSYQQPMMQPMAQPAAQPEVRLAGSGLGNRTARRAEGGIASLMDDVA